MISMYMTPNIYDHNIYKFLLEFGSIIAKIRRVPKKSIYSVSQLIIVTIIIMNIIPI